jgi:hypothetical protein
MRRTLFMSSLSIIKRFFLDRLPENEQIISASLCSGHGFKHSAALKEILAGLAFEKICKEIY